MAVFKSPVMEALESQSQISNRGMTVANSMMQGVQNAMNSTSDLTMKIDNMLRQEEAMKIEQINKTTEMMQDQYRLEMEKQLREESNRIAAMNAGTSASRLALDQKKFKLIEDDLKNIGKPDSDAPLPYTIESVYDEETMTHVDKKVPKDLKVYNAERSKYLADEIEYAENMQGLTGSKHRQGTINRHKAEYSLLNPAPEDQIALSNKIEEQKKKLLSENDRVNTANVSEFTNNLSKYGYGFLSQNKKLEEDMGKWLKNTDRDASKFGENIREFIGAEGTDRYFESLRKYGNAETVASVDIMDIWEIDNPNKSKALSSIFYNFKNNPEYAQYFSQSYNKMLGPVKGEFSKKLYDDIMSMYSKNGRILVTSATSNLPDDIFMDVFGVKKSEIKEGDDIVKKVREKTDIIIEDIAYDSDNINVLNRFLLSSEDTKGQYNDVLQKLFSNHGLMPSRYVDAMHLMRKAKNDKNNAFTWVGDEDLAEDMENREDPIILVEKEDGNKYHQAQLSDYVLVNDLSKLDKTKQGKIVLSNIAEAISAFGGMNSLRETHNKKRVYEQMQDTSTPVKDRILKVPMQNPHNGELHKVDMSVNQFYSMLAVFYGNVISIK